MIPSSPEDIEAAALLAWHVEMGADTAIGDAPVDRFAESTAAAARDAGPRPDVRSVAAAPEPEALRGAPRPMPAPASPALLTAGPDVVVLAAREQARAAQTLQELRATMERFEGCALKATATQLVFADGAEKARLMFVGEAPGREEDMRGLPFVGRSGQLLDRMLAAVGLDRTKVAIANIVPWRPPGNRTPTPQETAICRPFIERQIELVGPDVLVCLGAPSSQALLAITEGILKLRGRWMSYDRGGEAIQAMATLHPAYLLRQPLQKRLAWRDFRAIRTALDTK